MTPAREEDVESLQEVDPRNRVREPDLDSHLREFPAETVGHSGEELSEEPLLHVDDLLLVPDKAHLEVEARVLVQVPHGIVVLRAEHGIDLEDPLQTASHHRLFVELRRLRQVCGPVEVL